jgi:hypothetical protein
MYNNLGYVVYRRIIDYYTGDDTKDDEDAYGMSLNKPNARQYFGNSLPSEMPMVAIILYFIVNFSILYVLINKCIFCRHEKGTVSRR